MSSSEAELERSRQIQMAWDCTPANYRGKIDGVKSIMIRPESDRKIVAISELTDEDIAWCLSQSGSEIETHAAVDAANERFFRPAGMNIRTLSGLATTMFRSASRRFASQNVIKAARRK
jgi:hypothetical protein